MCVVVVYYSNYAGLFSRVLVVGDVFFGNSFAVCSGDVLLFVSIFVIEASWVVVVASMICFVSAEGQLVFCGLIWFCCCWV